MSMKMKSIIDDDDKQPSSSKWSSLSSNALNKIITILDDQESTIDLRLVCKNWGSSIDPPLVNLHPLLPITFSFHERLTFPRFRLVPTTIYLLRSTPPPPNRSDWWLVSVEQTSPGKLRLFHPLTEVRVPYDLIDGLRPDLEFIALKRGCNQRCTDDVTSALFDRPVGFWVSKVILWPNPLGDGLNDDYCLVRLYDRQKLEFYRVCWLDDEGGYYGNCLKQILFIQDHYSERRRGPMNLPNRVHDIELWEGMIYAVDSVGQLFRIDYGSFKVTAVTKVGVSASGCGTKRLVVSKDESDFEFEDLYLVVCIDIDEFFVYILDSEFEWAKVGSFGGNRIMFLGYRTCFFASTQDLENVEADSIIYPMNLFPCFTGVAPRPSNLEASNLHLVESIDYLMIHIVRYGKFTDDDDDDDDEMYYDITTPVDLTPIFWPPPPQLFKPEVPEKKDGGASTSNDSTSASGAEAKQVLGSEEMPVLGFEGLQHYEI